MASHAPLLRTNTAPVFQQSADGLGRLQNMSMSGAPRASQLSGSTAFSTSLTSLSSATTVVAPPTNGQVVATSNIINQKADASRSLYQICVSLKQRLSTVPDFDGYLSQLAGWEAEGGEDNGPVESLWRLLRTGHPLLTIYNALKPEKLLEVDQTSAPEEKRAKLATFKFVQACLKELNIPSTDMFVISDLTGNDTTGFVKVTGVVNYVLDLAEQKGLLHTQVQPYPEDDAPPVQGPKMSYRDHIVEEMVNTERKYVQDLENLYDLKKTLDQRGAVPGDIVHDIFLNINAILDFQRRFLIRVETTNSMPASRQEWGAPFVAYEDSFSIYQPFIANQKKATSLAQQVFDKIQLTGHAVAVDFNTMDAFLLKPMQRLSRYPLLLKDLKKRSEEESIKAELEAGIAAAERVLHKANEAVFRSELDEAMRELLVRVDDWKNHRVQQFGQLLLHGTHAVITGKSDQEKDYEIYLFECILLCCKEMATTKKDKKDKSRSTGPKPLPNRNSKLQLKGRIFMTNVTEVVSFAKPGSYTVQIWWKGDPGVESFVIRFQTEDTMKRWAAGLDAQRKLNAPQAPTQSPEQAAPQFAWMQTQMGEVVNPYAQQDEEEEDDFPPPSTVYAAPPSTGYAAPPQPAQPIPGTMSRNASSSSLRQRSATAESAASLAGMVRAPPPRIPLPQPPAALSVQTQMGPPPHPSPGPRGGDSYFSPVAESPVSSRTSTTSGFFGNGAGYPFPKTGTPQPGWGEDSNRYTAPAMPRAPSRDGPSPVNAYGMVANGRNPRGPSLPVMASQQSIAQQQRSRSYSTPDIQNQQPARRTERGGSQGVPAVPGIPPHLHPTHERHDSSIPRSSTGSPRNDLPIRSSTQSPSAQRERQQQQGLNQFPAQPIYPRQGTPAGAAPAPLNLNHEASAAVSPPLGTGTSTSTQPLATPDMPAPTQLKVKVNCDAGNYVTLVVAFNITYQSLIDRIDAKLARFTSSSISKGGRKLQYRDEDGDYVMIESDDDIQIAFLEWREGVRNMYSGGVGEIELYCVGEMS